MKKFMVGALAMVTLAMPFNAMAAISNLDADKINASRVETCDDETKVCKTTVALHLSSDSDEGDIIEKTDPIVIEVEEQADVDDVEVKGGTNFDATYANGELTITPKQPSYTLKTEEIVVYVTTIHEKGAKDCGLIFKMNGTATEFNPETGMNLPLVALGTVAIAGIGVYLVARKNTKLFKI